MRKLLSLFLVVLIIFSFPFVANADGISPDVSARAAILIDMDSGRVIFEKNADEVLPMASTTKIMTTLLALENCEDLDEYFTVDEKAIMVEGSSMGLLVGDQVNMRALCAGMLLESGNDAANAAAVRVGGSIQGFVELMNARAKELGLVNTSFETPSGLDGKNHHTTARELAIIAFHAMQNETFAEICSKVTMQVEFGNPPYKRTMYNHNRLLRQYSGTLGIKTGFTKKSGRCLVSACRRDGVGLICVTLNAPNDWNDHTRLYDAAFDRLASVDLSSGEDYSAPVTGGTLTAVKLKAGEALASLFEGERAQVKSYVELSPFLYAPVNVGDVCGEVVYELNGREIARVPLYAVETVEKTESKPQGFFEKLWQRIWDVFD